MLAFETIREVLLRRCSNLIGGEFADDSLNIVVADAVYVLLRGHPDVELSVDGWSTFHVVQETPTTLRAVGIMTMLPAGDLPMEVELTQEPNGTRYSLWVGLADERWTTLSEPKRWKSVYLYATQDRSVDWTWAEPISGQLADT